MRNDVSAKSTFVDTLTCLVELHLHLDGAISLSSARKLAKLQNIETPESEEELFKLMKVDENCKDLPEYLSKFDFAQSLLQTKEGLSQATTTLLEELKSQGLQYAEIRFAPQIHRNKGMTQEEAVLAAIEGAKRGPIPCGLILCCMRGEGVEAANRETLKLCEKYLGKGVVAIDLAGDELSYPARLYKDLFLEASDKGIPITAHAGEGDGPSSVRETLELKPNRIGHGVRALEDPTLTSEITTRGIVFEICPTSNLDTKMFASIADYPLKKLQSEGIKFVVNTDDMSISDTTLRREYNLLIGEFGLDESDVKDILLTAVDASFANDALKCQMREKIYTEMK